IVKGEETRYTRDGAFTLNANNELVTTDGKHVMGYAADETGTILTNGLANLTVPPDSLSVAQATAEVALQGNFNADGEVASGASVLNSPVLDTADASPLATSTALTNVILQGQTTPLFADGDKLALAGKRGGRTLSGLEFEVDATSTVQDLLDFYNQGLQIKTDETGPTGFTPGAVFDTSSGQIKITGNAGADNALSLSGTSFSSDNANMVMAFSDDPASNPIGESVRTSFEVYDSLGSPVAVDVTAVLEEKTDAGTRWRFIASSPDNTRAKTFTPGGTTPTDFYGAILSSGTLSFDTDGKLIETTGNTITLDRSATGATSQQAVKLDFSTLTGLAKQNSDLLMDGQDGFATGTLNGFSVGPDGTMTGTFSNGQTRALAQVAIAVFDNNEGLIDEGGNIYAPGANSGIPSISAPLRGSAGAVRSGSLEQSNVDISREFINMIISSTGFSAASRVISTSDQLLNELLQVAR
ncbi:MAG: flagellar hook-basal body complex protein, partial [Anaerolineae bacterium]|nr:flagellar hook-basal body complex protein [Phycisphaerae bacterium]